jgi:hypothetical protein
MTHFGIFSTAYSRQLTAHETAPNCTMRVKEAASNGCTSVHAQNLSLGFKLSANGWRLMTNG